MNDPPARRSRRPPAADRRDAGAEVSASAAPATNVKKSIARLRKALEKALADIDAEIDDNVRGSPVWPRRRICSLPFRASPRVTRTLIAEMPELVTLDRRQIAALAGLAPFTRQSGQWKRKSLIRGRRKSVRCVLFMAALVAARFNPQLKAFRDNLSPPENPSSSLLATSLRSSR